VGTLVNPDMKRLTTLLLVVSAGLLSACTTPVPEPAASGPSTASATPATAPADVSPPPSPAGPDRDGEPLPCDGVHVEAVLAPGEGPAPDIWDSAVVVTNLGPDACVLDGTSELEFFTGGDGRPLGINEVTTDDGTQPVSVILDAGDQASMAVTYSTAAQGTRPDCLEGGSFAHVTLPGDDQPVEAWPPDKAMGLPPVCGAVSVTSWFFGGAPGVVPN
jgi:Protein of unknown function (DUF4232)